MKFIETDIPGAFVIELKKIGDDRGYFNRFWCQKTLEEKGLKSNIAQINSSFNAEKGTLRGLHYQNAPYAEVKLVSCTRGSVFDVFVDLRPESPTFRHWYGVHLDQDEPKLVYVPEGCAHGYQATSDDAAVIYPTTEFYTPESEGGLRWDDPILNIEWPLAPINLSEKDKSWPLLSD